MQVTLSEKALQKVSAKGGQVAVDFIPPVGCGKVSEVSVSTNLKGRDTSKYRRVKHGDVTVYYSQGLERYTKTLTLAIKQGIFGSKLVVVNAPMLESECKTGG